MAREVKIPTGPAPASDTLEPLRATVLPRDSGEALPEVSQAEKAQQLLDSGMISPSMAEALAGRPVQARPQVQLPLTYKLRLRPDFVIEGEASQEELQALLPDINRAKRLVVHAGFPDKESKPGKSFQLHF